jgi:hypothetical protein
MRKRRLLFFVLFLFSFGIVAGFDLTAKNIYENEDDFQQKPLGFRLEEDYEQPFGQDRDR